MSRILHVTLSAAFPACLLLLLLPACVPVGGVPTDVHYSERYYPRNVSEESKNLLRTGQSTRKDVLMEFGEPDYVQNNEQIFIYEGVITPGGRVWKMIVLTPIGPGSGPWHPFEYEQYRLTIRFNENGRVASSNFERFNNP